MNELLNHLPYSSLVAFAMTYLLHSTVWILIVALLVKTPIFQSPLLKNYLWKAALIGGLTTSVFASFYGTDCFAIPIESQPIVPVVVAEQKIDNSVPASSVFIDHKEAIIPSQVSTPPSILAANSSTNYSWFFLPLLLLVWLMGSLVLVVRFVGEHWVYFKKISPRKEVQNRETLAVFKDIQQKLNLSRPINLTQSAILNSPILIQNQEICLPEKAVINLQGAQLEAMLAHEFAHIARKDYYWTCLIAIIDILFFFQPLHRMVKQEINNTNELLCDAWAAKMTGNNLALAECLLTVASWIKERPHNYALVAGMSLKKSELSNRVQSLIQFSNPANLRFSKMKTGLLFMALLAFGIFSLPAIAFTNLLACEELRPPEPGLHNVVAFTVIPEEKTATPTPEPKEVKIVETKKKVCKPLPFSIETNDFDKLSESKKQCAYLLEAIDQNNYAELKKLLVTYNPNCLYCGSEGKSAPINAAAANGNLKMVRLLIESGASLYRKSYLDEGALIAAARNGDLKMMDLFYEHGAYLDQEYEGFGTVLTNAIQYDQLEMVRYLLAKNADPYKQIASGKSAVDFAKTKGGKMHDIVSNSSSMTVSIN